MPHVAIVLIHYNSDRETHACLESLRDLRANSFSFSINILDNASKEPFQLTGEEERQGVILVRSDSNLGFTSGNNKLIRQLMESQQPDYFLLLNNDTLVDPDFLTNLVECAESHPNAAIVTPKIYFAKHHEFHKESYDPADRNNVVWFAGGMIDYANFDAFHIGVDEVDRGQFEEERQVEFVTGCCMLIRREPLQQLGMFDVRYFLYLEDVDLSVRFRRGGYELWYCPGAQIWHVNAGSSGGAGSSLHVYYQTRNRLFFFLKYASLRHKTNAQLEPAFAKRLPAKQLSALREEQQRSQPSNAKTFVLSVIEELRYYAHLLLLAWQLFWNGTHAEKAGVIDAMTLHMGKRAVV